MNKKAIILWIFTIIWMIVIFAFSTNDGAASVSTSKKVSYEVVNIVEKKKTEEQKRERVEEINPTVRKLAHAFEYAILCILLLLALKSSNIKEYKIYLIALIICILYATTDEIHQLFISGRSGELKDVIIDTGGATIGLMIYELIRKMFTKKELKKY